MLRTHRAQRGGGRQGRAGPADRVRALARRRVRLHAARRRPHRRHAHRLDRLRALGAGPDPASGGAGARAGAAHPAHALGPAGERERPQRRSRSCSSARSTRARTSTASRSPTWHEGDRLVLKRSADTVRFVHPPGYRYFATLREKLRWSEVLDKGAANSHAARARGPRLRHRRARGLELEPRASRVLTGETGAGKSILVDALELLVGGRGDAGAGARRRRARRALGRIRRSRRSVGSTGSRSATSPAIPGSVILRRTIDRAGRSRCFINGHAATLAQLKEAGELLVDIHGQHAHQSLLRAAAQRELARRARRSRRRSRARPREAFRDWKRLEQAGRRSAAELRRSARPSAPSSPSGCSDLKKLAPREGEWEQVERRAHSACSTARACSPARSRRSRR